MPDIHIEGKEGFNSKEALRKFKLAVKKNNFDINDLNKYIKSDYKLELVEHFDDTYKFCIKEIIVPVELYIAYKILSATIKVPIPSPKDVLLNPDYYKSIIISALNNEYVNKLDSKHPYLVYFKLLAKTLKLTKGNKIEENNTEEE